MSQKGALAQEIRIGSPDCFSSWEGGVWGRDYWKGTHYCANVSEFAD